MTRREIQGSRPLSQSVLWKLQQEAYKQFSVGAWTEKGVPFYLTSNPYTAKQYALIIFAYIRDCLSPDSPTPIDSNHPFYIFDLGAGSGRFSYLFLKHLMALLSTFPTIQVKPCLVMTDIVPSNIDFWERHSYFQEYFKEGLLDVAYYRHDQKKPIELIGSQTVLTPETVVNPVAVIGNYFFDTIPQDLFRIKEGQLEEGLIALSVKEGEENLEVDDPNIINLLEYTYSFRPLTDHKNYYPEPQYNDLLTLYCELFHDACFLFPTGGLETIHYFEELSKKRFLLLAGDQGVSTKDQVRSLGEPKMAQHGSFSFPVSYHLLKCYFEMRKGVGFITEFSDPAFVNLVAIEGGGAERYPEVAMAFRESFDPFEPKDYWKMISAVEEGWRAPSLDFILYVIKLGCFDPVNFHYFFTHIREQLSQATAAQKRFLISVIEKVWENFFPVDSSEGDFILNLGVLLFEMGEYKLAKEYFKRSLMLSGDRSIVYLNIASCCQKLGDYQGFQDNLSKAK